MPHSPIDELEARVDTTVLTAEELTVEAGKVEEFANAIGNVDRIHRSASDATARGLETVPAPLTFTRVSYFDRYRPDDGPTSLVETFDLGFDPRYTVHGEQAYEFERPVCVGDVLTGRSTLTDVYQREGGDGNTLTFATVLTEYVDDRGAPLVTVHSTFVETRDPDAAPDATAQDQTDTMEPGQVTGNRPRGSERIERRSLDDRIVLDDVETVESAGSVTEGMELPTSVVNDLCVEDFVRYAGASGDFHPLHYDRDVAERTGREAPVAQGMLIAGIASATVTRWLGIERIRSFSTRFTDIVWEGDSVSVTGEVDDVSEDPSGMTVEVNLSVTAEDGREVVTGSATAAFARREAPS